MTLGRTPLQPDLWRSTVAYCQGRVAPNSIYGVLHRESHNLFPDRMFADVFAEVGRRSVPPLIVAVVMVLQRFEGLSDREAADRFAFDARWKYAAGGLDFDYPGFAHTVLVDMRARLARSDRPDRIFEVTLEVARRAGLVGRKRVLDSTPLYDAVATMDTVTLIRSAIRGLLRAAGPEREAELRGLLARDDDYAGAGKPVCDWEDRAAREALVDALAKDAMALLGGLDGRAVGLEVAEAAALLATVVGQDLDTGADGVFRIARRVAKDRVISTVDPQARHGHKTSARGFDGYKGHVAVDPDSEIITDTEVSPGNVGDAAVAEDLIDDLIDEAADQASDGAADGAAGARPDRQPAAARTPAARTLRTGGRRSTATLPTAAGSSSTGWPMPASTRGARPSRRTRPAGCSPRTASTSTSTRTPSPAQPGTPRPSARTPTATESPTSPTPAPTARCAPGAPTPRAGAPSGSAATNSASPAPAPASSTRTGSPTTGPPAPKWNARSAT